VILAVRTGDRRGARGVYLVGFSVFITATLLTALAPGFECSRRRGRCRAWGRGHPYVLAGRHIRGLRLAGAGDGLLIVYGTAFAVAGALGPLVGGSSRTLQLAVALRDQRLRRAIRDRRCPAARAPLRRPGFRGKRLRGDGAA
jgi:MFS family permease